MCCQCKEGPWVVDLTGVCLSCDHTFCGHCLCGSEDYGNVSSVPLNRSTPENQADLAKEVHREIPPRTPAISHASRRSQTTSSTSHRERSSRTSDESWMREFTELLRDDDADDASPGLTPIASTQRIPSTRRRDPTRRTASLAPQRSETPPADDERRPSEARVTLATLNLELRLLLFPGIDWSDADNDGHHASSMRRLSPRQRELAELLLDPDLVAGRSLRIVKLRRSPFLDQVKLSIEHGSGQVWDWWPLSDPPRIAESALSIHWTCVCYCSTVHSTC